MDAPVESALATSGAALVPGVTRNACINNNVVWEHEEEEGM